MTTLILVSNFLISGELNGCSEASSRLCFGDVKGLIAKAYLVKSIGSTGVNGRQPVSAAELSLRLSAAVEGLIDLLDGRESIP
jgi:hypothetical protein